MLAVAVAAGDGIDLIEPKENEVVLGTTRFVFAVDESTTPPDSIDVYVGGFLLGTARAPEWEISVDVPARLAGKEIQAVALKDGRPLRKLTRRTRQVGLLEDVAVPMVQLYPVVVDRRGRFVQDLERDDFEVLDQHRPIAIERFSVRPESLRFALVLDVSRSMQLKIAFVREASLRFLDRLEADDEVGLFAFNHALMRLVPIGTDREAVRQGIRSMTAGGGTALNDAMFQILERMDEDQGRKVVFLFSDGRDERSIVSLPTVVQAAHRGQVIIYAVGTIGAEDEGHSRADLETLANETGGEVFFLRSLEQLDKVFDSVVESLRSQYALGYTPPPGPEGLRAVEVRVRDPKLDVRCRQHYYYEM